MSQTLNFGDLQGYSPYDGDGQAALLPFDGFVKCTVKRFKEFMTNGDPSRPAVKLVLKTAEENLPAATLYAQAITGGAPDRNGDSLARQFADVLISSGLFTAESLQAAAQQGKVSSIDELMNQIINEQRPVYVEVQADTYKGKTSSKINNFVTKAIYEREVAAGTAQRPRVQAAATPNGAGQTGAASGMLQSVLG